jgi:hypothetical protein
MAPLRPPPPPPPPPGRPQRPQQRDFPFRSGAAGTNGVHKPRAHPTRRPYALPDQDSEFKRHLARSPESAAQAFRDATHTYPNSTNTHNLDRSGAKGATYLDSAANMPSPDTTPQDSEAICAQWVAQGRQSCRTCNRIHPPPCRNLQHNERAGGQYHGSRFAETIRFSDPRRDRDRNGLPSDFCYECGESHPWPDEDGTSYHTRFAPFWAKPPPGATQQPSMAAQPPPDAAKDSPMTAQSPSKATNQPSMTAQPPPEATRESDLTGLLELIRTEARPAAPATAQDGSNRDGAPTHAPDGACTPGQQVLHRSDEQTPRGT